MTPTAVLQIDATNNLINVADTTNYPAIPFFFGAAGIARLEYPPGILYQNAGYALNNFGAPDILYPAPLNFDTAIILVSGLIPEGTYTLRYKNQVSKQTTLLNASTADNSISVDIGVDDVVAGMSMVFAGGANDGTRVVQSVTTDGFGRKITFTTPIVSNTPTGTVTWTIQSSTTVTIDYCNVTPKVSITQEYRCDSNPPLFIDTDTSTYAITVNGASITPSVINRTHWTRPPRDINNTPVFADYQSAVAQNVTTQLWTGNWTTDISTELVYNIPAYGGNAAYTLTQTVTGQSNVKVKCDTCLCEMATCINRVRTDYNTARLQNTSDVPRLRDLLIALEADYLAYSLFKQCGDTDKLAEIVASIKEKVDCDCSCDDEDDSIPRQIIPEYPIAINGVTAVVVPGSLYVTVSSVSLGGTTTYTVDISTADVIALIVAYLQANPSIVTDIVDAMQLGVHVTSAVVSTDTAVAFTGTTTAANNIITGVVMGGGLVIADVKFGDPITCSDFPAGTYVTAVGTNTITVNNNAIAGGAGLAHTVASTVTGITVKKYKRTTGGVVSFVYLTTSVLTVNNYTSAVGAVAAGTTVYFNVSNLIPTGRYLAIVNFVMMGGGNGGPYEIGIAKDGVLIAGSDQAFAQMDSSSIVSQGNGSISYGIDVTLGQMLQVSFKNTDINPESLVSAHVSLLRVG